MNTCLYTPYLHRLRRGFFERFCLICLLVSIVASFLLLLVRLLVLPAIVPVFMYCFLAFSKIIIKDIVTTLIPELFGAPSFPFRSLDSSKLRLCKNTRWTSQHASTFFDVRLLQKIEEIARSLLRTKSKWVGSILGLSTAFRTSLSIPKVVSASRSHFGAFGHERSSSLRPYGTFLSIKQRATVS